jgi:hypothetical protein
MIINKEGSDMATKRRASSNPVNIRVGLMGNGVHDICINAGQTIGEIFEQHGFELGETVKLNNRNATASTRVSADGSVITSTGAVKGG